MASLTATAVLSVSVLAAPAAANAAESEADSVVAILESVPTEVPVMEDVSTADVTDLVAPGTSSTDDAAVKDVADVFVSASGEDPLSVELLSAQDAPSVSVSLDDVEVIDNGDSSWTVPLEREDGSLQVVFVIETPDAPTRFGIDVEMPEGIALTQVEGGALIAMGSNGQMALGVAPAWAFDAAGAAVPTHYVVEGSVITQVVDHASGDYQYPISADPWLSQRLFSPMTVNRNGAYLGKNVYSGRLTAWGVAVGLSPSGISVMTGPGLGEFTGQWGAVSRSTSLRQQYLCHAVWGRAIIGAGIHWDIEAARPANGNYLNVAAHGCNWRTT